MLRIAVALMIMVEKVLAKSSVTFSVEFHGITDTLKPEHQQYAQALKTAAEAFEDAETLFEDPDFVARRGWTKETEASNGDGVYSKNTKDGKMIAVSTVLDGHVDAIMRDMWTGIDKQPTWDSNVDYASVFVSLTNYSDIVTYGSNNILIISGRDIVAARLYRPLPNGGYRLVYRSVVIPEKPEVDDKIRAHVYLGAFEFRPHPDDPEKRTLYDFATLADLKGMLPKFLVNQVLPKVMVMDTDSKVKHFKELVMKKP